jgi:hypothetical protein
MDQCFAHLFSHDITLQLEAKSTNCENRYCVIFSLYLVIDSNILITICSHFSFLRFKYSRKQFVGNNRIKCLLHEYLNYNFMFLNFASFCVCWEYVRFWPFDTNAYGNIMLECNYWCLICFRNNYNRYYSCIICGAVLRRARKIRK